jgi:acyl carrier protein
MNNKEDKDIERTIKKALADLMGIEPEDVENDYSLTEDLHMKATDLTDFMEILSKMDFDTNSVDFSEVETFSDLIDSLTQDQ